MTGYLTYREKKDGNDYCLAIPNMEIRNIFVNQIMAMFKSDIAGNGERVGVWNRLLQKMVQGSDGAGRLETIVDKKPEWKAWVLLWLSMAALLHVDFHSLSEEQAFSYLFTCLLLKAQKTQPAR